MYSHGKPILNMKNNEITCRNIWEYQLMLIILPH